MQERGSHFGFLAFAPVRQPRPCPAPAAAGAAAAAAPSPAAAAAAAAGGGAGCRGLAGLAVAVFRITDLVLRVSHGPRSASIEWWSIQPPDCYRHMRRAPASACLSFRPPIDRPDLLPVGRSGLPCKPRSSSALAPL